MVLERNGKSTLELIALRHGVPVEEVRSAIESAAQDAIRHCKETNNTAALEVWAHITKGTGKCSAEELIEFLNIYVQLSKS